VSTATVTRGPETARRANFISDRLGSALAILPLGVWTMVHLWNNLAAFQGAAAWQSAVTEYAHPFAEAVTLGIVLLPLLWHIVWGIGRIFQTRPNYPRYGYFVNLKYIVQRLSALGLLAFLGAHLWLAFLKPRLLEGQVEPFADIAHEMHFHRPTLVVYILGVLAIAYHLGNGVHTAMMGWGVVETKRALRRTGIVAWVLFVVMLVMGWGAIFALFQAGKLT
jgi:succinate dehydrogenase / fumarate reductase, cytochrome b subunit